MAELRFLDFDLETVTPLLSGGAFYQPEIRAPSYRSVLRYWMRALLGGVLGPGPELVRYLEGVVFGTTQHASLLAVRATGEPATAELPVDRDVFPGIGYLFYSVYYNKRNVILPEGRFHLRLQTRPFLPPDFEVQGQPFDTELGWRLAAASLWLSVHLGAFGHRMRRGAGVVRLLAEPDQWPEELPPLVSQATTPQALAQEYATHLTQLRQAFGWSPVKNAPAIPAFNILHPSACQIYVLDQTYPDWQQALDAIGQVFKAFRSREPEDYENVKGFLMQTRRAVTGLKRAIFGLPIMFFFSSLYRELMDQGVPAREARWRSSAMVMPRRGGARPSPLWLKVVRLAGDEPAYAVQMLLFRSRFLPDNRLSLRPNDRSRSPVEFEGPSEFSYVQSWFDHVAQTAGPLLPVNFS